MSRWSLWKSKHSLVPSFAISYSIALESLQLECCVLFCWVALKIRKEKTLLANPDNHEPPYRTSLRRRPAMDESVTLMSQLRTSSHDDKLQGKRTVMHSTKRISNRIKIKK